MIRKAPTTVEEAQGLFEVYIEEEAADVWFSPEMIAVLAWLRPVGHLWTLVKVAARLATVPFDLLTEAVDEAVRQAGVPPLQTLDTLLREPPRKRRFVWEDVLPFSGMSILAAEPSFRVREVAHVRVDRILAVPLADKTSFEFDDCILQ